MVRLPVQLSLERRHLILAKEVQAVVNQQKPSIGVIHQRTISIQALWQGAQFRGTGRSKVEIGFERCRTSPSGGREALPPSR